MKKIMIAALLFAGLTVSGFSQERPKHEKKTPEERAQLMTDKMAEKLSLTNSQKNDVYKINLDRAKEIDKLRSKATDDRQKTLQDEKKIFQNSEEKINKVLNDDQKKTYADLREKRMEKMKAHRHQHKKSESKNEGEAES